MKKIALGLYFVIYSIVIFSQNVENMQTVFQENKAVLIYDLIGNVNDSYLVEVYSSQDNFELPITFAIGDAGSRITEGKNKKITIDLEKMKINLIEDLRFKLKATLEKSESASPSDTLPANSFVIANSYVRRGRTNELSWPSNNTSILINIEIYKNGKLLFPIASNIQNSGLYKWKTRKSLAVGKDYQLRIVQANNPLHFVKSNMFMIKPQVPTVVKVLIGIGGAALIGGVVYALYYTSNY